MFIVTGGSRGLGKAICERLVATGRPAMGLARNIADLPYPAMACDVSNFEQVSEVAQTLRRSKAEIHGIINAAGIASMNLAVMTPPAVSRSIVEVNLLGTIYVSQLLAPLMMRRKAGAIINFSTIAVAIGLKGESIYAASKAGVEGFTRAFAREMADFQINVNCIAPGPIDTDLLRGISGHQIGDILRHQVIQKQFLPSDICDLVESILDPRFRSVSGQVLHVGGV